MNVYNIYISKINSIYTAHIVYRYMVEKQHKIFAHIFFYAYHRLLPDFSLLYRNSVCLLYICIVYSRKRKQINLDENQLTTEASVCKLYSIYAKCIHYRYCRSYYIYDILFMSIAEFNVCTLLYFKVHKYILFSIFIFFLASKQR